MQTIDAFDREFPNEIACKLFLVEMRWPDGVTCPRCGEKERVYLLKARPFHWLCKGPSCGGRNGYRFSVITHTIFENTKVPLKLWFKVAYLVLISKKGISALQIHRTIFGEDSGSAYHTSWYMVMRWRAAMKGEAFPRLARSRLMKRSSAEKRRICTQQAQAARLGGNQEQSRGHRSYCTQGHGRQGHREYRYPDAGQVCAPRRGQGQGGLNRH